MLTNGQTTTTISPIPSTQSIKEELYDTKLEKMNGNTNNNNNSSNSSSSSSSSINGVEIGMFLKKTNIFFLK